MSLDFSDYQIAEGAFIKQHCALTNCPHIHSSLIILEINTITNNDDKMVVAN